MLPPPRGDIKGPRREPDDRQSGSCLLPLRSTRASMAATRHNGHRHWSAALTKGMIFGSLVHQHWLPGC
jgi:hypothetical protein